MTIVCLVFQQSLSTLLTRDGKTKKSENGSSAGRPSCIAPQAKRFPAIKSVRLDNRTRFKSDAVTDLLVSSRFVTEKVGKDGLI